MRFFSYLMTFCFAVVLASCGGGGGSPGLPSGTINPLITSAPATLTVGVGASQSYAIKGGKPPYTVASSNAQVGIGIVNDTALTIGGVAGGAATIQVADATGLSVSIALTVANLKPLSTTAPTAGVNLAPASSSTYAVQGGVPEYRVNSSNERIAFASLTGSSLTINALAVGSATVTVTDANNGTVAISVTVASLLPLAVDVVSPINMAAATTTTFSVVGGVPFYTVSSSSDARVATASISGTTVTVRALAAGTAGFFVRDSAGATVPVSVTVGSSASAPLFTSAPSPITIAVGGTPTVYDVGGGVAPLTATSQNTSVAKVTIDPAGTKLSVTGVAVGATSIQIRDSAGTTVTIAVTVVGSTAGPLFTSAPSPVTIAVGGAATVYDVGGGVAPLTVTSQNTRVATATIDAAGTKLSITGVTAGATNIQIRDSAGTTVTIAVTVVSSSLPLSVTPNSATGIIGDKLVATVIGGTAPYTASVGNTLVTSATIVSGNQLQMTLAQAGQTVVTVLDANNQATPYSVTVNAATPGIRLSPSPVSVSEFDSADIVMTVFGSQGAISVFSSDTKLLKAVVAGTTVTISTGTAGNRCVPGNTAVTITAVDSTSASATATINVINSVIVACP